MAANIAPTMKNWSIKSVVWQRRKIIMPIFAKKPCLVRLQLDICTKLASTLDVPNMAPFIQRRRYFINTIIDYGASVKALASGTQANLYRCVFLIQIYRHIILSSARYSFASEQVGMSVLVSFLKKASRGSPLMAYHLKSEQAPGSTWVNPKKDSHALSGV